MNAQFEDWIPILCVGLIVVPVGLLLGYFFWINNSSDTREMRAVLFESKPYDVRSIAMNAGESTKKRPTQSLVSEVLVHSDANTVAEIVDALATNVEGAPPNGVEEWMCMLRVTHAKRIVDLEVIRFADGPTWIYLKSNGSAGWNLGTYQCQALGTLLERLAGYQREREANENAPEVPLPVEEAKQ